jgi:hypothetical protein
MSKTHTYQGWLHVRPWPQGEGEECVFLFENKEPSRHDVLYEEPLFEKIAGSAYPSGRTVFARWWSAEEKATKDELNEAVAAQLLGAAHLKFGAVYSDLTGYLWTDNEFTIGGHDLNKELGALQGKWVILEIEVK